VGFDFTEDEMLVVFYSFDSYLIIDPYTGFSREKTLKTRFHGKNMIREAKIVDNKIVFYTCENDKLVFYIMYDIFQSNEIVFNSLKFAPG
jgi:hypothetical protein